jgi:uroporphyrinogen-III synthase
MSALAGKRIVNTRAIHQAGELDELLRAHEAVPLSYPCIAIEPVADSPELDSALADLCAGEFDWLALTSANAVHVLAERTGRLPSSPTSARLRTAVVGPGTAEAARRELGVRADVMPASYRAVELAAAMAVQPGERVLIPQSEIASPDLAEALRAKGAVVTTVTAYRTVTGSGGVDLPALLARGEVDAVVFASSSAVEGFVARLEGASRCRVSKLPSHGRKSVATDWESRGTGLPPGSTPSCPDVREAEDRGQGPSSIDHRPSSINLLTSHVSRLMSICIGPNTARTARAHGLSPIVPEEQTLAGVIDALAVEFGALSKGIA